MRGSVAIAIPRVASAPIRMALDMGRRVICGDAHDLRAPHTCLGRRTVGARPALRRDEEMTIMSKTTQELKIEIQRTMLHLHALGDEARMKLQLAKLDLKEAWSKLEPKLEEAEKIAEDASEATLTTITKTVKRLEKLVASF
jgi:hypothetical protein